MTLIEAIRKFIRSRKCPVHVTDLYRHLPDRPKHSIRARVYENLGRHFRRVGKGLYVAINGKATCIVVEGDAWDEIPKLPSGSVDALVTDPPYSWLDRWVGQGTSRPRMQYSFERADIDLQLGLELNRVLKDGAHVFIFVPAETATTRPHIERLIGLLEGCGFVFNRRWVWDKKVMGLGYSGRGRHEGILFLSKGKMGKACNLGIPDVLAVKAIDARLRKHPTEKPVPLLKSLIRFATRVGDLVLDCFAGSCSTGHAARALGRDSILIEKNGDLLERALEKEGLTC